MKLITESNGKGVFSPLVRGCTKDMPRGTSQISNAAVRAEHMTIFDI